MSARSNNGSAVEATRPTGLFRKGDRVRSMITRRTGYVRERRESTRLGDRYVVDWDGGLEYSLVRPIELELVWPAGRGGVGKRTAPRNNRGSAAD